MTVKFYVISNKIKLKKQFQTQALLKLSHITDEYMNKKIEEAMQSK